MAAAPLNDSGLSLPGGMVSSQPRENVEDGLLLLAYEEAGQAVIAWLEGARLGDVTLLQDAEGNYHGNARYWPEWDVTARFAAIKHARISLGGPVAAMVFTDSSELWNDDAHDVEKAEEYLTGTGIAWCELAPYIRGQLERDWARVVALAEALLKCRGLSGHKAVAIIRAA